MNNAMNINSWTNEDIAERIVELSRNGAISDDYIGEIAAEIAPAVKQDIIETADNEMWNDDDLRLAVGRAISDRLHPDKEEVYVVVKTRSGFDCATHACGGFPTIFKTDAEGTALEKAKAYVAEEVSIWNQGMHEDSHLRIGHNDNQRYESRRYDSDGLLAWIDEDGELYKVEAFALTV